MPYDDNYGDWEMGDSEQDREETMRFYRYTDLNSVWKVCSICERKVRLMPQYDKCDSCCRLLESGWQY